jgi:hypothetical protein
VLAIFDGTPERLRAIDFARALFTPIFANSLDHYYDLVAGDHRQYLWSEFTFNHVHFGKRHVRAHESRFHSAPAAALASTQSSAAANQRARTSPESPQASSVWK